MDMELVKQRAWRSWVSAGLLAVLCTVLAVVQSRWIGELSLAESDRLREQLQAGLNRLSGDLNGRLANACAGLMPDAAQLQQAAPEMGYSNRYRKWKESHEPFFRRLGLVVPEDGNLSLYLVDLDTAQFTRAPWPAEWQRMQERLAARLTGSATHALPPKDSALIELPRFPDAKPGEDPQADAIPQHWLVAELNLDYIRNSVIPDLLKHYLGGDYDAEVVTENDAATVIYHSMPENQHLIQRNADAAVGLLDNSYAGVSYLSLLQQAPSPIGVMRGGPAPPAGPAGPSRWKLLVRHRAGSLEDIVARARLRNIALSASILLLILATVTWLIRISRQAQRLADLQMNFVAGVSHELSTPLTVIRTAAFNLRGKIASRPEQVERYGMLIQDESEKLAVLVDQILRYGSARSGQVLRQREPVSMAALIEDSLRSSRANAAGIEIEREIAPGLPLVLADEQALKHAIKNLIDNAVKYGTEGTNWIGVFACTVEDEHGQYVEFRVVDHGPGIPADEQPHIFDPFFRGRRAVQDQIHGTGLGLNLVKKIVEAHGGSVTLKSEPMKGTEFAVRIPVAPPELQDEFAHTLG